MKQKILLMLAASCFIAGADAQKKSKSVTAYAITAAEKGNSRWTEVRLVDLNTGEEVQSVYKSSEEIPALNARTGKPIVKKDVALKGHDHEVLVIKDKKVLNEAEAKEFLAARKEEIKKAGVPEASQMKVREFTNARTLVEVRTNTDVRTNVAVQPNVNVVIVRNGNFRVNRDAPFATQSAACAYDKKHERLYYTPMGINQLRFIDLKSRTPQVFYFEDEPFGALSGPGDVPNQITRMVIGGDGNGYALTNNAAHLIRFTTNKKSTITDLGELTDDAANGKFSVHNGNGFGGDIIADKSGNLYLITANRAVYKINIETRVATYKGSIKGLPKGFTTNGAVVESGTKVVVTSSTATSGYYIFDLSNLQAEKLSAAASVYNASDLANSNLISDKQLRKEEKKAAEQPQAEAVNEPDETAAIESTEANQNKISVYPNPVTNNVVKLSFTDYPQGRYALQVLDLNGKAVETKDITINSKTQVQELRLPTILAKGNYLIRIVNESGKVMNVEKLIVQ